MTVLGLAAIRLHGATSVPGSDFQDYYLPAARAVRAGESPYDVEGYVYTPLLSLVLAPVARSGQVYLAWTTLMIACGVLTIAVAARTEARRLTGWKGPAVAMFAGVTLWWNWPVTLELFLGQADLGVLVCAALAAYWCAHRRMAAGAALAFAGLLKTWPALLIVWTVRRPARKRASALLGAALTGLAATLVFVVMLGPGVVPDWVHTTISSSEQPLVAWSAWGFGQQLFTDRGPVTPWVDAPALAVTTTVMLLLVAAAVLVRVLLRPRYGPLDLWHIAVAVVLLLPVSHLFYLSLGLPIGWIWFARLVRRKGRRLRDWAVMGCWGVWWVVTFRIIWPGDSGSVATAGAVTAIVGMSFLMLIVSVVADAATLRPRRIQTTSWSQRTRAPSPA